MHRTSQDLLERLPHAAEASFNSYAKQNLPYCLPNTRASLLKEIYSWADGDDKRSIFWLNGLAGTGKSTIARTVAWTYWKQSQLGASFFFARGGGDIGSASKFVTTIARQLVSNVPALAPHISSALSKHRDVANLSLRDQWQILVHGPLMELQSNGQHASYVVVVDALDECAEDDIIRIIPRILAETGSFQAVRLRVLLTSRAEIPIQNGFSQVSDKDHKDFILHNIAPSIVDHDIKIFLEYSLTLIGNEDGQGPDWPGVKVIKDLVKSACGLFIWAATACRFIGEGLFADERLDMLLNHDAVDANPEHPSPEEHLNQMYLTVLRSSLRPTFSDKEKERLNNLLKLILGSIAALASPLSLKSLSMLLAIPKKRTESAMKGLHAILDMPNDHNRSLRLHHPSFRDFLFEAGRSDDFWVDEKQAHERLAIQCLELMSSSLYEDVCGIKVPGESLASVESSRVEQRLPPEVRYACLHWVQHLERGGVQLQDDDQVHTFLQEHLLHWFEALGWIGRVSDGIHGVTTLESIVAVS